MDWIRKISILWIGIILGILYLYSWIKLFRINNKRFLHIETIAVFSWFVKIVWMLLEEFVVNDEIFEFVAITVYTTILAFILYKFIKTFVENAQLQLHFPKLILFLRLFYVSMAAALLVNLIIGIATNRYFEWNTHMKYRYHWHIAIVINAIIWYLNIINGIIIFKMRGKVDKNEYFSVSKRDKQRIKKQMIILIFGYAAVSTLTLIWFWIFPLVLKEKDVRWAHNNRYWVPRNEISGIAAIIKTILLISPTILFWLWFFYYRMDSKVGSASIKIERSETSKNSLKSMERMISNESPLMRNSQDVSFNDVDTSRLTTNTRKTAFNNGRQVTQSFYKNEDINISDSVV